MNRWKGVRIAIAALVAAIPASNAFAQEWREERVISGADQLLAICREEAEAHYAGRGEPVYQWTGSYHDYANTLHANGKLRVDGRDVAVRCRSARNARERYMTIAFDDPGR